MALHQSIAPFETTPAPVLSDLWRWTAQYDRLHVDLGTGDGRFALTLARQNPTTGVIGLDTILDHLRGSGRRYPGNVRFVQLDALDWPLGSIPTVQTITINFPYGSLLRGLTEGDKRLITRLDALLGSGSRLEIRVNETALVATGIDSTCASETVIKALGHLDGLCIESRELRQSELWSFPSTWAKRLGYGRTTLAFLIETVRLSNNGGHCGSQD